MDRPDLEVDAVSSFRPMTRAANPAPTPGDAACPDCGHETSDHRPGFGCIEVTPVGDEWEGCLCEREAGASAPGGGEGR